MSGNDVRIDPKNPNIVYAALWQQQQSYLEGAEFGGAGGGIFKSTDGGTTWSPLTNGLPAGVIEANLGISMSNPSTASAAAIFPRLRSIRRTRMLLSTARRPCSGARRMVV
jgi:hypothetical protein